jgi:hypothetical protein
MTGIAIIALSVLAQPAPTELPREDTAAVYAAIEAARARRPQIHPRRLIQARAALQAGLQIGPEFVARRPVAALDEKDREQLIAESRKQQPDLLALQDLWRSLFDDREGLENPRMLALRDAVREYHDASYYASLPDADRAYQNALDQLEQALRRYEQHELAEDRIQAGHWTGWLARSGWAPDVVAVVHARFSRPNNYLGVNGRLIQEAFTRDVEEQQPVDRQVLGSLVQGTARVNGQTYARLVPDARQATLELGLKGRLISDTHCVNGTRRTAVTVQSHLESEMQVHRLLHVGDFQGQALNLTPAEARLQPVPADSYDRVSIRADGGLPWFRNLRESMAWRIAQQRIPESKAEGLRQAENELAEEANRQQVPADLQHLADQVAEIFQEFYILPQTRGGVLAGEAAFSTSARWLSTRHIRRTTDELAAASLPPLFDSKSHDIAVSLHESEFSNTFNQRYGGKTVTDHDLKEFLENVRNYVPRPLRKGTHLAPWSMTFVAEHPVRIDVDKNQLEIRLQIARVDVGSDPRSGSPGRTYALPLESRVVYRLVNENHLVKGERAGNVELRWLDEATDQSADREQLRAFLHPKLDALFMPDFYLDGLTAVRGGFFEPLTYLRLDEFRGDRGWLLLGWHLTEHPLKVLESASQLGPK